MNMQAISMEGPPPLHLAPLYPGLPLLGSTLDVQRNPLETFTRASRLGSIVELRFPSLTAFLLSDPKDVDRVLHENVAGYDKQTRGYAALRTVLGNGLFTSEGSFWLRQRRLAQPAFHKERMAGWAQVMVNATTQLIDAWAPRLERGDGFDVHEEMMRLTLRVVGEALLSTDVTGAAPQVGEALDQLLRLLTARTSRMVPWPDWVPTPANVKLVRARDQLDAVVNGIIAERRQKGAGDDLLGMLMSTTDADTGERMDDSQLRDEVMTILLAGHETTANALSWTFWLLGRAPQVERRLRDELTAVLGGRPPTAADAPKLKYTSAVLHEALRLYPPVWALARHAVADDVVGGVRIPKDALVFMCPWLIHRNSKVWADPEAFDPERWMTDQRPKARCAFLPFSSGPRKCIGDQFALLEGQLVLATLMQRVHLSLVPGRFVEPEPVMTLRPRGGVWVTAKAR
jgi:cytochrome P450